VIFCRNLGLPEAPLLLRDGSWLVAELAFDRGTVKWISADGKEQRVVARTGRPNGLALDRHGAVWVGETLDPALIRLELDGSFARVPTEIDGAELLWPNDLCFGPDGALYITDSGVLVRDFLDEHGAPVADWEKLALDGKVIRFDPRSGESSILDSGYQFTNGIAFGLDRQLYVNETMTGNVYRYRLHNGQVEGERELFANVYDPEWTGSGIRGPDGMAFAADGRLFVTVFGQGDVTVLGTNGGPVERIPTLGKAPTNVAFGRPGDMRIYVVEDEHGQMEVHDVGVDGLELYG
jgi:gluconolactonase